MKNGWQTKKLGHLFVFKNGRAFKKEEWTTTGLPIIRIQNLNSEEAPFNYFAGEYSPDILVEPGDLLFSWSGTVGSSFGSHMWSGETGVLNQHIFKVSLRETIAKRYAFYGLRYITEEIEQSVNGAVGLVHITKEKLNDFTLPIPPLPEQQRIVGALDDAFEGIATAEANTKKNLQNARALFESHLQSVFAQRGPGWVDKSLGDLCDVFADGDWVESKDQSPDGIRLIQTGNVGEGVFKDRAERARYISEVTFKRLRCTEIFKGDCLISRLPDPVGRSCILPDTGERMITAVDCTIVRFDPKQLLPAFFNHYSQSDNYLNSVAKECTGTTRSRISRSNLALIPISVPPLAQQKRLVTEFDVLREETQRLANVYERKLAALEALKKSLLHEAFAGQLTATA